MAAKFHHPTMMCFVFRFNFTKIQNQILNYKYFIKKIFLLQFSQKKDSFVTQTKIKSNINMERNIEIDKLDLQILALLMEDANMPYTEIGKKINVSGGTIHVRMKKLEATGVVKGSALIIDQTLLGWDIVAFLGIYLDKSSMYDQVAAELKEIPEIVNVHYTTGIYSIFAKITCKDTAHLKRVLHDKIQKIAGIQRTETFISLEESISRSVPFDL